MNPSILLKKLIEIELSIGNEIPTVTRSKVLDLQGDLLKAHWEVEEDKEHLDPWLLPEIAPAGLPC